jgi:hypothetical protein
MTRCIVERTLGILKESLRFLLGKKGSFLFTPERSVTRIIACAVLHNLAKGFGLPDPEIEDDNKIDLWEEEEPNIYFQYIFAESPRLLPNQLKSSQIDKNFFIDFSSFQ